MLICKIIISASIKIAYMQEENLVKLARVIKEHRKKKKLSLSALAYRIGVEPSTVYRIENGLVDVRYSNFLKIIKILDIDTKQIF